jgi:hypothetical protein
MPLPHVVIMFVTAVKASSAKLAAREPAVESRSTGVLVVEVTV